VAHWDTQHSGRPPRLLGEIKGTPTIRFFKPKPKQKPTGSNAQKIVTDYNGERKGVDMKRWADYMMPSYIEEIVTGVKDLHNFQNKASRNSLPQVLLFPSKDKTMPLVKFLSTEFRRKLLLAEVKPSNINRDVMLLFNVTDLPALVVIPLSSHQTVQEQVPVQYAHPVPYQRKKEHFTRHKLHSFLSKYALKQIVTSPPKNKEHSTKTTTNKQTNNSNQKVNVDYSTKEEL